MRNKNLKAIQRALVASSTARNYSLYWRDIFVGSVVATTERNAVRKTPKPYHRYRAEIEAREVCIALRAATEVLDRAGLDLENKTEMGAREITVRFVKADSK